jgi:hypothetical protein
LATTFSGSFYVKWLHSMLHDYYNIQLVSFFRFYMVTWNVATRHPEEDLAEMLGFGTSGTIKTEERLPDFYVIG